MKRTSIDETLPPLHIVSWSGGKDSTATIIIAHRLGIRIDKIIISLPWFSKKKKIYADDPDHVEWVLEYAKPLFESWGYEVVVLSDDRDYIYWFNKEKQNSKYPEQNGLKYGFVIGGMCKFNLSKIAPIKEYIKGLERKCVVFEGIAADEPERITGMIEKRNHRSLLYEQGIEEPETFPICSSEGLLSPVYKRRKRQGCWFCPNQSLEEMADRRRERPDLWSELEELAKVEGTATRGFKYGKTFQEVNEEIDRYLSRPIQLSIFDSIYSE